MGKNHGNGRQKTEADRLRSVFAKLDNEIAAKKREAIKNISDDRFSESKKEND